MKLSRIFIGVVVLSLSVLFGMDLSAQENKSERIRHQATINYDGSKITVRTQMISFDTGLDQVSNHVFNDPSVLPPSRSSFNQKMYINDTPNGVKGYAIIGNVIYEFDYVTLELRKVKEFPGEVNVQLWADAGLYYVYSSASTEGVYSVLDNELISKDASVINSSRYSAYEISPMKTEYPAIYCPNDQKNHSYKLCSYLTFGGKKVNGSVKVTSKSMATFRSQSVKLNAGKVQIQIDKGETKDRISQFHVKGITSGKTTTLYRGNATQVKTFVSPNNKHLVLTVETNSSLTKVESSDVYVYRLDSLELIQKYPSLFRAAAEKVFWVTDELYLIYYILNAPGAYPPSFYYIPEKRHFKTPYDAVLDLDYYSLSTFSYDDIFYPVNPIAITSGKGHLHYKSQPAFNMNSKTYVPLEEFAEGFHIQYKLKGDTYYLTRNHRVATLSSKIVEKINGKVYVPLGQWNRDLGLKVGKVNYRIHNTVVNLLDDEQDETFRLKPVSDGKELP